MADQLLEHLNFPHRKPQTPISLSAYAELHAEKVGQPSQSSSDSNADSIHRILQTVEVKFDEGRQDGARLNTALSEATTSHGLIAAGTSRDQFKEGGFSQQESHSQRSIPFEPFWPMIRRREPDRQMKQSDSPRREVSPKKHSPDKLQILQQRLIEDQNQLEFSKQQLMEERRLHEIYVQEQRDLLKEELDQIERRKESLIIRQMLLERNCVAHGKRNKQASRHRIELFCYKLTHALKIRERQTSMKYHFLHLLACSTQRSQPHKQVQPIQRLQKPPKVLQKVKSCEALARSISPKRLNSTSNAQLKVPPSKPRLKKTSKNETRYQLKPRELSAEPLRKPTQQKTARQKVRRKQMKCTRSNIIENAKSPPKH